MCEYSKSLIAWMDGELAKSETAAVEQHVRACAVCRECYSAYQAASSDFASYYSTSARTAVTPAANRRVPMWAPVAAAIVAVAAMLAMALVPRSARQARVAPQIATAPAPNIGEMKTPVVRVAANLDAGGHQKMAGSESPQGVKPGIDEARSGTAKGRAVIRGIHGTDSSSAKTELAMADPAIQIAIPADAMFPPGAVPDGLTYIANVSLGPNGSVQGIRLQP